jgi:hypothetical protein
MNERNINSETTRAIVAQDRNGLAPRGGLAFDGTTNCRAAATLTGQVIGTDDVSLSAVFRVPLTASEQWIVAVGPTLGDIHGGAGGLGITLSAAGHLQAGVQLTAGYEYRRITNFQATYAGKVVHVAVVRSGASLAIYVNGAAQATIAGDSSGAYLASNVQSTYLLAGSPGTNYSLGGTITLYSATLYNLALTAADVLEIYELGGAVPERFKFGSQTARYTSDYSAGADGWSPNGGTLTGNIDTIGSEDNWLRMTATGTQVLSTYKAGPLATSYGKRFRIKGRLRHDSASLTSVTLFENSNVTNIGTIAVAQNATTDFDFVWANPTGTNAPLFVLLSGSTVGGANATAGESLYVKNFQAIQLGAVTHYDADADGIGYQLHDQSTNKLDAVLTTTGVSWTKPKLTPNFFRGYTSLATNEQLASTAFARGPLRIINIYAKASAAATVFVGISSGGAELVASIALSVGTDYQRLTLKSGVASFYNGDGVITNLATSIWVNSTTANRIDWYVTWEPINP